MIEPSRPARLLGSSRSIDRPVMVLPQPLSPTMPTRSPGATSKSILRVACQTPCAVLKRMPRPRTDISGGDCGFAAPFVLAALGASITIPALQAGACNRPTRPRCRSRQRAGVTAAFPTSRRVLSRDADRVVRGFFCLQKIARKCGCGKRKFHSGCQNEIGSARLSQPSNAMASARIAAAALAQGLHCVQNVPEQGMAPR